MFKYPNKFMSCHFWFANYFIASLVICIRNLAFYDGKCKISKNLAHSVQWMSYPPISKSTPPYSDSPFFKKYLHPTGHDCENGN